MNNFNFNIIDSVVFTIIILVVGISGIDKISIAMAIPFIMFYVIVRPSMLKKFPNLNKKQDNDKEPENQKEFEEFYDDDDLNKDKN